jgi:hypothetical protein
LFAAALVEGRAQGRYAYVVFMGQALDGLLIRGRCLLASRDIGTDNREDMDMKSIFARVAIATAMTLGLASGAQAALVSVLITTGNNDCSGVFGTAPNCNVEGPTGTKFSPLIVKYDMNGDATAIAETTINSALFPNFDGSEITFNGAVAGNGTWAYSPEAGDPGIKYWVAKAGDDFNLFWEVAAADVDVGGACVGNVYTDACLSKALVVTSGSYSTPGFKELSHIGFYDTTSVVPLPAAAWLLGSGLLGLFAVGRRRKGAQVAAA